MELHSGPARDQYRQVVCENVYNESFSKGLKFEGLKEHSLSEKTQLLTRLQEKVLLFSEKDSLAEYPPEPAADST